MATVTAKINMVILNVKADTFFVGANVFVPLGCYAAKDLPAALDAIGGESIEVEYKTVDDPKARKRDEAKFSKRLAALGEGWTRTDWQVKVIDGYLQPNTMVCTVRRAS